MTERSNFLPHATFGKISGDFIYEGEIHLATGERLFFGSGTIKDFDLWCKEQIVETARLHRSKTAVEVINPAAFNRAFAMALAMPWDWNQITALNRKRQLYLVLCSAMEIDPFEGLTQEIRDSLGIK